ncbi:MAG: LacI family transcriptional regulator [Maritimibacter sp.]|nr:LacI family transcriptional regulator [Maritimibacter sp.]
MESPRITQRDVALRAGVSQATVSTWLSGNADTVAPETAERIRCAIAELGYRPNRFARALRTQRSMVAACVVPDLLNPFYPALLVAAQQVMEKSDYELVAVNTGGRPEAEAAVIEGAANGRYDGILGVFFTRRVADFAAMISAGVSLVRIEAHAKRGGELAVDDIFVDNAEAARQVTRHLLDLGHRRIAMIAGEGGPQSMRLDGYVAALREVGLKPELHTDPSFSDHGGEAATRRMLEQGPPPTAIVAANDLMAIGAMRALTAAGLAVGRDVSVIGFDDIMPASLVSPRLTTVALNQDRMGRRAAELLLDRMQGRFSGGGRAFEMPFDIVIRESVAPPGG